MSSDLTIEVFPWAIHDLIDVLCMCLCVCVCVCELLSHVWLFVTPWTVTHQVPLSMEFSRLEYWTGLPFPFPGDLSKPAIELKSPTLQADSFPSEPPENMLGNYFQNILTINI